MIRATWTGGVLCWAITATGTISRAIAVGLTVGSIYAISESKKRAP